MPPGYDRGKRRGSWMSHFRDPVPRLAVGMEAPSAPRLLEYLGSLAGNGSAPGQGTFRRAQRLPAVAGTADGKVDATLSALKKAAGGQGGVLSRTRSRQGPFGMRLSPSVVTRISLSDLAASLLVGKIRGRLWRPMIPDFLCPRLRDCSFFGQISSLWVVRSAPSARRSRPVANAGILRFRRIQIADDNCGGARGVWCGRPLPRDGRSARYRRLPAG